MTLLDRFRTQPAHKHPDATVRLAAVAEIPLDDRELIAAVAREDDDPRVRRAAVAKLMDPSRLGVIAREDADESVKGAAIGMLREIALEAFEGLGERESLEAVDALPDGKTLLHVARSAAREVVALRALASVSDPHALGAVARHAVSEAARLGALARLRESGEAAQLLAVALNSEHKDTGVAAVEALGDRDALEQIAARGRNKSAVKRARMLIREADERAEEAAAQAAAAARAERAAEERARAAAESSRAAEASAVQDESAPAVEEAPALPVAAAANENGSLAAEVGALAEAAATEASSPRGPDAPADAAGDRERHRARLAELADEASAAAADPDLAAARKRIGAARREWLGLGAGEAAESEVASRWNEAEAQLAARENDAREADARARREALGRLHNLLGRVETLVAKPDLSLKAADRALRDVRAALGDLPVLPSRSDAEDVTKRLRAAQEALTPRVLEMREAEEWQRWANVGIQEQLIVRMEALREAENPEAVANEVRQLQQQWRQAADVPRAQADALWRRFKAAHDAVWPRCEAHFAAEAQARAENLTLKMALCEKAEALADSSNWIQTAEAIKGLQAEWKTLGPVPRGREKMIWERFRTACDRFFTRRHEDLVQRKKMWSENFARKEALCVQAEALAESTEWEQTAAEIRRLQAEWKTIGPVKKSRSEAVWQRFRGACDRFFERYAHRHDVARAERVAAREAICVEIEALAGAEAADPPADLVATIRALRGRWQQEIAARGVDPDTARALEARAAAAVARVAARWPSAFAGSELDPESNLKRMRALVAKVEELAASVGGPAALSAGDGAVPATRLAAMLKEALASNTIGGKADEESRRRAAADEARQAQAAWSRIGVVPDEARRPLEDRFHRACRKIMESAGAAGRSGGAGRPGRGGAPVRPGVGGGETSKPRP